MSKRRKGNDFQRWIKSWLELRGWTVRNFPVSVRPIMTPKGLVYAGAKVDVWGADLCARKPHRLIWVQGSCSGGVKKRVEDYQQHFGDLLEGEDLLIFLKTPKGPVNVKRLVPIGEGRSFKLKDTTPEAMKVEDVGKIILGKWYSASGWEF